MRFLQLKNPWSHLRWKGRYCERDEKNWTPELLKYLNFDPKTAQKFDNGISDVFWPCHPFQGHWEGAGACPSCI